MKAVFSRVDFAQWKNSDNIEFYYSITPAGLELRAEECGLAQCPDLELLRRILSYYFHYVTSPSILEIGAGYGRVIQWLLKRDDSVRITALEPTKPLYEYVLKRFAGSKNVRILNRGLFEFKQRQKFDIIFWMWAGFFDFSLPEKQEALHHIARLLSMEGVLVIETPVRFDPRVEVDPNGNICLEFNGKLFRSQMVNGEQMKVLAAKAGLSTEEIPYRSPKGLERVIYLLRKAP